MVVRVFKIPATLAGMVVYHSKIPAARAGFSIDLLAAVFDYLILIFLSF